MRGHRRWRLAFLPLIASCSAGNEPAAPATSVASVTVALAVDTLAVGDGVQLTATLRDAAGNPVTGPSITYARTSPCCGQTVGIFS